MRLVSYGPRGSEAPGALVNDTILPLPAVMTQMGLSPTGGIRSVLPFLSALAEGIDAALERGDEDNPGDADSPRTAGPGSAEPVQLWGKLLRAPHRAWHGP